MNTYLLFHSNIIYIYEHTCTAHVLSHNNVHYMQYMKLHVYLEPILMKVKVIIVQRTNKKTDTPPPYQYPLLSLPSLIHAMCYNNNLNRYYIKRDNHILYS